MLLKALSVVPLLLVTFGHLFLQPVKVDYWTHHIKYRWTVDLKKEFISAVLFNVRILELFFGCLDMSRWVLLLSFASTMLIKSVIKDIVACLCRLFHARTPVTRDLRGIHEEILNRRVGGIIELRHLFEQGLIVRDLIHLITTSQVVSVDIIRVIKWKLIVVINLLLSF